MDYHIDRRVILSEESGYKNLYDWSLKEFDGDGKQVDRDLVPWAGGVSFTARDLVLVETLTFSSETLSGSGNDGGPNIKREATKRQSIRATLHPRDLEPYVQTGFSMFGTDRALSRFELFIYELREDKGEERCFAWGSVSYTFESELGDDTVDDVLVFNLFVRPERFAQYAERIASSTVDEVVFNARGVAGFYSGWSPSIITGSIKVLTDSNEHKVEIPGDCTIEPPRLGEVAEPELHFHRIVRLEKEEPPNFDHDEDTEAEAETEPSLVHQDELSEPEERTVADLPAPEAPAAVVDERVVRLLSSVRFAAWGIAFLLLLLLFK